MAHLIRVQSFLESQPSEMSSRTKQKSLALEGEARLLVQPSMEYWTQRNNAAKPQRIKIYYKACQSYYERSLH